MGKLNAFQVRALEYIRNTGYTATVLIFDEDHEPIGAMLRGSLMPEFMVEGEGGQLQLTPAGRAALSPENGGENHG